MKQMSFKLSVLIFLMSILSGFYLRLPFMDNLLRSFVIFLVFSVVVLVILIVYNQSTLNMLGAHSKKEDSSHPDDVPSNPLTKTSD